MKYRTHCNVVITLPHLQAFLPLQSPYIYYYSTVSLRIKQTNLLSKIKNLNFCFKYKAERKPTKKKKKSQ